MNEASAHAGTAAQHIALELYGCDRQLLDDRMEVEQALRDAAGKMQAAVVKCLLHQFAPQGVTGFLLLDSAELTVHTWPEHGYAAVDLYAPMGRALQAASDTLAKALNAQNQKKVIIDRGLLDAGLSIVKDHVAVASTTLDLTQASIPEVVKVDRSPGRGLGLFVTRSFEKGEVLYEAPGHLVNWLAEIVIKTDAGTSVHPADDYGYEILPAFVETWPESTRDMLGEHYGTVTSKELVFALTDEEEYEVLITGVNGLQNHSDTPNTVLDFDAAEVRVGKDELPRWIIPVRALCPINTGDEIFTDYRHALPDFVPDKTWLP